MTFRYRGSQIESYMPAIDSRMDDRVRILDGRNFEFDVKGPKAGFGNQILTPFPFGRPDGIQGLRVRGKTLVITQDAIMAWREHVPYAWEILYAFQSYLPNPLALPWFSFYMENMIYVGHPSRGIYEAEIQENTQKLDFKLLMPEEFNGLPEEVYGAAMVRNRIILVTKDTTYWSATGNFTTLDPSPGGAGFQLNDDFVSGDFLGIAGFQDGFVIWTTGGGILAEYIGGDLVWRWSPLTSQERPIGPWAIKTLSNGMTVFLSVRGLKYTVNGDPPQDWTPEFNEFFRGYATQHIKEDTLRYWRMAYDMETEHVYISESVDGESYWRTYVLHPTLDKWGILSDKIYGLIPFTPNRYGFVDMEGIPRYFDRGVYRDAMPNNGRGLNRTYPRIQKVAWPPSSSAVSRVRGYNETYPIPVGFEHGFSPEEVIQAGWHDDHSMTIQQYDKAGLDSWVEIGYLRPGDLGESADGNIEIHEVVLSTPPSSPAEPLTFEIQGFEERWDWGAEDWSSTPLLMGFDFAVDLMDREGIYDLNKVSGPPIDTQFIQFWVVNWPAGVESEDWNLPGEPEDWNGPLMGNPPYEVVPEIHYSMDGSTGFVAVPELARFDAIAQHFTVMTHGNLHRLKLKAENPLEYFHVTYLELTEQYGGQWI